MKKILNIIFIRLKQGVRAAHDAGWGYLLLAVVVTLGVSLQFFEHILQQNKTPAWGMLLGFGVLSLHVFRLDRPFLQGLCLRLAWLFFIEYSLLCLPFLLVFLASGNWASMLSLLGIIGLVALLPLPVANRKRFIKSLPVNWIPVYAFEIRTGMRRTGLFVALFVALGLVAAQFIGMLFLVAFVVGMSLTSWYDRCEPKEFIEQFNPQFIVLKKSGIAVLWAQLLLLPQYLAFFIFHGAYWYFVLIVIVAISLWAIFVVGYKYAVYHPRRLRVENSLPVGLFLLGLVVPFLLPMNLFALGYYWRKARKNMSYYYADNQ